MTKILNFPTPKFAPDQSNDEILADWIEKVCDAFVQLEKIYMITESRLTRIEKKLEADE